MTADRRPEAPPMSSSRRVVPPYNRSSVIGHPSFLPGAESGQLLLDVLALRVQRLRSCLDLDGLRLVPQAVMDLGKRVDDVHILGREQYCPLGGLEGVRQEDSVNGAL